MHQDQASFLTAARKIQVHVIQISIGPSPCALPSPVAAK